MVDLEEVPAPTRLAPWSAAISMRTRSEENGEALASGRFVVLHDPIEQVGWNGNFRLVAQCRSQIDHDMGTDPALAAAMWDWMHDCLYDAGASYHDLNGTVTRELSESFGGLELRGATAHVEVRASWTPSTPYLGEHLHAWADLMCRTSGAQAPNHLLGA